MSKFTPGPWGRLSAGSVHAGPDTIVYFGDIHANPLNDAWEIEQEANANLIAAAPDMYEALKNLEVKLTYFHAEGVRPDEWLMEEWAIIARAALAKADGKP